MNYRVLFWTSFIALYFELLTIRYLSAEIRVFDSLKNLPLIACFFGIAMGMLIHRPLVRLRSLFPAVALVFFLSIRYASWVRLYDLDLSWNYGFVPGSFLRHAGGPFAYLLVVLAFLAGIVVLFAVLGNLVGEQLRLAPSLRGYGINIAGSLAGVLCFSLLAFFNSPPGAWMFLGLCLLAPLFLRKPLAMVAFTVLAVAVAIPDTHVLWSPYYKIEFTETPRPTGWSRPSAYTLIANHIWYQYLADLSPEFLRQNPSTQPNRAMLPYYDIPYQLVTNPKRVLILGAGTGNDVAGALRHGAEHIDAVELDPVIYRIGKQYHPEHPYDSARVTVYIDDARAFLAKSHDKYDLIVFAFLDSHTLLSSFSSLRLDNYVYTQQSFEEARTLLTPGGTVVVSFATSRSFPTERLFGTLGKAFGVPPTAYLTEYWVKGTILIEGAARARNLPMLTDVTAELNDRARTALLATDDWPFLYLERRSIPAPVWLVVDCCLR